MLHHIGQATKNQCYYRLLKRAVATWLECAAYMHMLEVVLGKSRKRTEKIALLDIFDTLKAYMRKKCFDL